MIVSRTGYTGEDGFELYTAPGDAADLWRRLLEVGGPSGLVPAGLGARDTLRLEAAMALYGHELDDSTTPLEAGAGLDGQVEPGRLHRSRGAAGAARQPAPRAGWWASRSRAEGSPARAVRCWLMAPPWANVTSGTWSPSFEKAIGLAYVAAEYAQPDRDIELEVRRRKLSGRTVELPFYRRD